MAEANAVQGKKPLQPSGYGCDRLQSAAALLKKLNDFLASLSMTLVAAAFLLLDLVPHVMEEFGAEAAPMQILPFDPAWVTVVICGIPLLYLSIWRIIYNRGISKISSALLISMAMLAAIAIGDLFAAGEVAFIMALGALLEEAITERAKKGLKNLLALSPTQGRRIRNDREEMIALEEIVRGDVLRILPGERIPVDGTILAGETSVDQSVMTGESLPVDKGAGEEVFCGTLNCFGSVDVEVKEVGESSSLQRLIRMVQEAEEKQAPMQRIADRWASWLVPIVLVLAVGAYAATANIIIAVTLLVVFCPCALVLATPTAIMAAIGQATKRGVIIKSGKTLEKMGEVDTIAFDKTGTLTRGKLSVSDVLPFVETVNEEELLQIVASAEARSEHPLGKAIVAHAKAQDIALAPSENFRMTAGRGVSAKVTGRKLLCGSEGYLAENGIMLEAPMCEALERLCAEGKALVLAAEGGRCIGTIALSDTLRPEAKAMVERLHTMDVCTVLLTGDNKEAAVYFASQVGIDEIRAGLLPEDKVAYVRKLQEKGRKVLMIGDGVNDAPALKCADISAAMGAMGSDIAVEAADIALMRDDVGEVPYLKRLANATATTIKLSITLSMCINFAAIVLSLMQKLNPTTGALVHNAGSCFVVLIAALLYDRKFD